jgi:hypothetical protein
MSKFYFLFFCGLIVASLFFGGYLIMGDVLKELTLLRAKNSGEVTKEESDAIDDICQIASSYFQKYFITTAFSLAGVVLVTGVLFSAVNNMDFAKLYYSSFGKNLVNYDTVYLFGGLYSLLILLFYLPLRLTFSQLNVKYAENPQSADDGKFFSKDLMNRFKELITISTPLLAGVVQMIIDAVGR